jgi:fumarate reductase flavoprotein subunit
MGVDADVDVLVIGAGACGLAAAIAAHDAGAEVAIIEKLNRPGGNSALSTGSVPAAGTRFQREAGIADSTQRFIEDLMRTGGATDCPHLVRRLVETSAATVEWLVDCVGARMTLVTAYKHVGHSLPRLHAPASRRGRDLVDDLLAAVEQRGIPLAVGNGATALIADSRGGVIGADIDANGERQRVVARKTVLAVNGFAANRDLVARFCPEIGGAQYFGARGSAGEAVLWGEELGAALGNIAAYQGYAAVADPHGSLLSWTTIEKGGIIINAAGKRFGDESAGYSGFTPDVMAQGGPCFAIFDQKIFDVAALEEEFVELTNYGGIKKADTPAALAKLHGLDPAAVTSTIQHYNSAARGDAPDAFGRRDFALAPFDGALYVCRVVPGLFHTQGGLMVDCDGRVLRPNGESVANLFAGGGAAAGLSGRASAGGYASGNGLLSAIGLGRLAGLAAAKEIKDVIARTPEGGTKQSRGHA